MKKVLFISYYWPPSGGAGVQRVLKTTKYLWDFDWEPIVFTAKDAAYPITDESLQKDVRPDQQVLKGPIWEPYEAYKSFTGKKNQKEVYSGFLSEDKGPSFTEKAAIWVRGNFFIPDARMFWINPSVRYLTDWLKTHEVDAILSSGPPHTVHMIARRVKRHTGLPWVADFRDPWTNIDFYDQLMLTGWADRRHRRMERQVMHEADHVTTVSWVWADECKALGAKGVSVIPNGFDHADFEVSQSPLAQQFVCSHIGYLNRDRNNRLLWEAFAEVCEEVPGFREKLWLRFIGKTDFVVFQQLEALGLMDRVEKIPYIPHSEVLTYTTSTQVLLLMVNNVPNVMGHIPGKTYEYIGSRRPILATGPETADFAQVIQRTESGIVAGFEDKARMKQTIIDYFRRYEAGNLTNPENRGVKDFTRRAGAGKMAQVLGEVSK